MGKIIMVNPSKRRKPARRKVATKPAARKVIAAVSRAASAPAKRRRRATTVTVKSNPIFRRRRAAAKPKSDLGGLLKASVMPSVIAAGGALSVDVLVGYANRYLPANMQVGMAATAVKFAGAVGLGMVASKVKGKEFGVQVMSGGLTVQLHELLKSQVALNAPQIPLAGMGVYDSSLGVYDANLAGSRSLSSPNGITSANLGFYNPAVVAGQPKLNLSKNANGDLMAL